MTERDFFRNSASECRRLACRAAGDRVRRELLLWAREFDRIADEEAALPQGAPGSRTVVHSFGIGIQREPEAAD